MLLFNSRHHHRHHHHYHHHGSVIKHTVTVTSRLSGGASSSSHSPAASATATSSRREDRKRSSQQDIGPASSSKKAAETEVKTETPTEASVSAAEGLIGQSQSPQPGPSGLQQNNSLNAPDLQLDCLSSGRVTLNIKNPELLFSSHNLSIFLDIFIIVVP